MLIRQACDVNLKNVLFFPSENVRVHLLGEHDFPIQVDLLVPTWMLEDLTALQPLYEMGILPHENFFGIYNPASRIIDLVDTTEEDSAEETFHHLKLAVA